jgi:pyruvate/2-oxoglutarate dehydrogenase complex dihydrolipoamide dehydrogenase (E3) component
MRYDAIIVGAGQAAPGLASDLTKRGWQVALCEGAHFGGSCVNYGCSPSKTLIGSANAIYTAQRGEVFGFRAEVEVDFARVMQRQRDFVQNKRASLETKYTTMQGLTVYREYASFEGAKRLRVGDQIIEGDRIYLDVGSRAVRPKINGLDTIPTLDHISLLDLCELPRHLVILGGGYIAVEYGQAFHRFGAEVTIIENGGQILDREDPEIAEAVQRVLQEEGIRVMLNADLQRVMAVDGGFTGEIEGKGYQGTIEGSHLLIATGRAPNSEHLVLDKAGVRTDEKGYIQVDDHLNTNIDGIYALGDVNGRGAFTHTSYDDFLIIKDNLDGGKRTLANRVMAYAVYSDPPLGRAGMTEAEARESGRSIQVATLAMDEVDRALEFGQPNGLLKVIVDKDNGRVLGVAHFGLYGDEVVQGFMHLMYANVPYTIVADNMYIHPTITEMLPTVLAKLK